MQRSVGSPACLKSGTVDCKDDDRRWVQIDEPMDVLPRQAMIEVVVGVIDPDQEIPSPGPDNGRWRASKVTSGS